MTHRGPLIPKNSRVMGSVTAHYSLFRKDVKKKIGIFRKI